MNSKPWYESRGIWGALVTIAVAALSLAGITIQPDEQAQFVDLLMVFGAGVGGVLSLVGRIKARSRVSLKRNEFGLSHIGFLAVLAVLSVGLYGCPGTVFEVRKAEIPVSQDLSPLAQAAQTSINEANVALAAAKQVIRDKAANGIVSADEAQTWLDRTRALDEKVDAAQSLLALGDPAAAKTQAEWINTAIVALQAEIAKRARETDDGGG